MEEQKQVNRKWLERPYMNIEAYRVGTSCAESWEIQRRLKRNTIKKNKQGNRNRTGQ